MSERKVVGRNVAVALGAAVIILLGCLGVSILNYMSVTGEKDTTISSLNSLIESRDSQISSLNSQISSLF